MFYKAISKDWLVLYSHFKGRTSYIQPFQRSDTFYTVISKDGYV